MTIKLYEYVGIKFIAIKKADGKYTDIASSKHQ